MKKKIIKFLKNWLLALMVVIGINYIIKYGFKVTSFTQVIDTFKKPFFIFLLFFLVRMLIFFLKRKK